LSNSKSAGSSKRWARGRALASGLLLGLLVLGCRKKSDGSSEPRPVGPLSVAVRGNPFLDVDLYVAPYSNADQARRRVADDNPAEAALIGKIADTPQARWLGEWSGDVRAGARNLVRAAKLAQAVPLFVAYNIPGRDCGQHSRGGAAEKDAYNAWISGLAEGIGREWRGIIVLEPDALGQLDQCLGEEAQQLRLRMLRSAVDTLSVLPGVSLYLDAGHSRWAPAEVMAERLEAAGVRKARGFALNTSNFRADAELIQYGERIAGLIGGDVHFVIDSSRNGNGPAPNDEWCNPKGRGLGRRPAATSDGSALDAFVWLKNPGESDGSCNGGPSAGQWYHEQALELARNARW